MAVIRDIKENDRELTLEEFNLLNNILQALTPYVHHTKEEENDCDLISLWKAQTLTLIKEIDRHLFNTNISRELLYHCKLVLEDWLEVLQNQSTNQEL